MNILMVHTRYLTRGGEDESVDAEVNLLRSKGHTVDLLEFHNKDAHKLPDKAGLALSTIWSADAYRLTVEALSQKNYDVVHCQNLFQAASPSVYYAAEKKNVPVVQSIRNYRFVCPAATLFRDGNHCELCINTLLSLPSIINSCYRGSRIASTAVAAMRATHQVAGTWRSKITKFIAISDYVRQVLLRGGFDKDSIWVKPNFANITPMAAEAEPGKILYVGRFSTEKGVQTLLQAFAALNVPAKLACIGAGAEAAAIQYGNPPGVEFLAPLPLSEVYDAMRSAWCVVVPSEWAEPFGRVVVEALGCGTPVIAANSGGLSELITPGETGMLYEAGDAKGLAEQLTTLISNPEIRHTMSINARSTFEKLYSPEANYGQIISVYRDAIASFQR